MAILWAAVVGSFMKWTLNEGIARWQMATGTTLLEGWVTRLGRWIQWVFLTYFVLWSFFVGGALVTAGTADIGVADLDYAASFPSLAGGLPPGLKAAVEWASDELDDDLAGPQMWREGSWAIQYLRSFGATIPGGTSEIQRNIIAERVLGLPRA